MGLLVAFVKDKIIEFLKKSHFQLHLCYIALHSVGFMEIHDCEIK